MAHALDLLGKQVRLVNADPPPEHYFEFPGVDRIEIAREVTLGDVDCVIVMESGDFARTGVSGLGIGRHRVCDRGGRTLNPE